MADFEEYEKHKLALYRTLYHTSIKVGDTVTAYKCLANIDQISRFIRDCLGAEIPKEETNG